MISLADFKKEKEARLADNRTICASDSVETPNGRRIVNNKEHSKAYARLCRDRW